jgi:predicted nucleic acid-binding protein
VADAAPARILIDTDVASYLFRGDTQAARYRPHLRGRRVAVSFMTVAELDRWARERDWGAARRAALDDYLRRFAIYLVDRELCRRWADVVDGARRAGRPIQTADAWIAATALAYGLPLVTHNAGDYAGVAGLTLITESGPPTDITP